MRRELPGLAKRPWWDHGTRGSLGLVFSWKVGLGRDSLGSGDRW